MGLTSRSYLDRSGDDSLPPPSRYGRTQRPYSPAPPQVSAHDYLDSNRRQSEKLLDASGVKTLVQLINTLQHEGFAPETVPLSVVNRDIYRQEHTILHLKFTLPGEKKYVTCNLAYRTHEVAERRWRLRFDAVETPFSGEYTGSLQEMLVHTQRYSIKLRGLRQGGLGF